ncbi:metal ABC transporter substrate-binding protein [Acinetobacter sp. B5B]|uniref:MetQ/NlpA family ABC transporter substrate-binding protein n=1 Tax=Acinetobacter baretiae TaxID=2605383 RepID=UPI0018C314E5|nr:MetQ/NlpA family ABC transporter substrate-binding protein [Acinetobacter baretiae]MBF7681792.1 metal ABC transporter substrate-binding protein [Acinetobacter baretiae]
MKKTKWIFVLVVAICLIASCSNYLSQSKAVENTHTHVITLGSMGADAQIWKYIAQSDQAKKLGLNIDVKEINDGVALNQATLNQEIDVNAFQSWGYLKAFNDINHHSLVAIATTYLEPMGLYSQKYRHLNDLPDKAIVAIPNDTANTARALRLLEHAHLITLSQNFNTIRGSTADIINNPKQLVFKTIQGSTIPRVIAEVDLAAIGNTIALDSGLNVLTQSLIHENVSDKTAQNINVLVTRKDKINYADIKKLGQLYHEPFVQTYIATHFAGTKVDVNQPVNHLP